jgi:transposase, IS5 family
MGLVILLTWEERVMKQGSLAEAGFARRKRPTRREVFLEEMKAAVPWDRFEALILPHYPAAGNGRRPYPLSAMLRIHFMQQWFGYSDPAMEEALWETPLLRRFAGIELGTDSIPDETTILNFRHLLEARSLGKALFDDVVALLSDRGLMLREGTSVDATLIAAPPSTKNRTRKRDPEMSQTKKGAQWYFGMKAHIGVDSHSGLVHTAEITTARVSDAAMGDALLHGEESFVLADRGYCSGRRSLEAQREEDEILWATPFKRTKGQDLTDEQRRIGRFLSSLRANVEHVFRVMKRQFGYTKTRYRGLYKNGHHAITLLALSNIFIARRRLTMTG